MIADQRDAAKALALQFCIDEHGARGVRDAIDPETAFGIDPFPVRFRLQLRRVEPVEIFCIAADLPGEGLRRPGNGLRPGWGHSGCGVYRSCRRHYLLAPGVAQVQHVERVGADVRERRQACIHQWQ